MILPNNITGGTNGPDVVKKVRDKFTDTLVVFGVTSSDDSDTRYKFLKSGADDCLIRPFYKEEFNARIMNIIRILSQKEQITKQLELVDKNIITSSTNEKGLISNVSEAFCRVAGYTKEELIGRNHNIVRHPDNTKEFFKDMWKTISSGKPWEGEFKNMKSDGSSYWVQGKIVPEFEYDGTITGYTAIRRILPTKYWLRRNQKNWKKLSRRSWTVSGSPHSYKTPCCLTMPYSIVFLKRIL